MAVFTSDTLVAVKAIRIALLADSEFRTGVDSQVYYKLVQKNFTYPYAFIDVNAAIEDNSSGANMTDFNFLIKVVGLFKTDYENLVTLSGRIYGLLHKIDLSNTDEDWFIWHVERSTIIDFIEFDTALPYSHVGGIYRLRLSS